MENDTIEKVCAHLKAEKGFTKKHLAAVRNALEDLEENNDLEAFADFEAFEDDTPCQKDCCEAEREPSFSGFDLGIKMVQNGIIIQDKHDTCVFEEDDKATEVETFANALRHINMLLGPSTSKYSPQRIYVNVEPGYDYIKEKE